MAKWIKLNDFCYYQRLESSKGSDLDFTEIHTVALRKLGSRRKGFEPCAVKFSLYQPKHSFENYTVEATCTVILPKRSGITATVSKDGGKEKKIPGADFFTRILAVQKGATLKIKTMKSDASFNNVIFLYDTPFVRSPKQQETENKE